MFSTLIFDTNMNMYITKSQGIESTEAIQFRNSLHWTFQELQNDKPQVGLFANK